MCPTPKTTLSKDKPIPGYNEATARVKINLILISAIREEKLKALEARPGPTMDSPARPANPTPEPARLYQGLETRLDGEVRFGEERRMLQGNVDFFIWYDRDEMGANLVVLEAKRCADLLRGEGQLLAYMGRHSWNS
jgi:hypothetical protein